MSAQYQNGEAVIHWEELVKGHDMAPKHNFQDRGREWTPGPKQVEVVKGILTMMRRRNIRHVWAETTEGRIDITYTSYRPPGYERGPLPRPAVD